MLVALQISTKIWILNTLIDVYCRKFHYNGKKKRRQVVLQSYAGLFSLKNTLAELPLILHCRSTILNLAYNLF